MKNLSKILFVTFIVLLSCSDNNEPTKTVDGYFKLVQIQAANNARVVASGEDAIGFDLGNLKASKEFYFILQSSGGTITDITLEMDNPRFSISPGYISKISGESSIMPLLSIGVTHGVHLNGFGFTDLLEMGEQSATLTVRGKTIENGTVINIESTFTFKVNAKKLDIKLFDGDVERDLTLSDGAASGVTYAGGLGALNGFSINSPTNVKIENTGNVDITVSVRSHNDAGYPIFHSALISPGQTTSFSISGKYFTSVGLDGNGTVMDNNRIQMGNDGKGYFWLDDSGK